MKALLPSDEKERLEALRRYDILDTEPEQSFDDLALLASQICDTPIASITLIDEKRQWFKSKIGLTADETPRDIAFCAHTILQKNLFVVGDAQADERFASNPLVTGDPKIRFYAGLPIIVAEGQALGTICVIDRVPRILTAVQKAGLEALSRRVIAQLELRHSLKAKMDGEAELLVSELSYRRLFEAAKDGILILDFTTGHITDANPFLIELLGFSRLEMIGKTVGELSSFEGIETNQAMLEQLQKHGYVRYEDLPMATRDGRHVAVEFVSNVYEAGNKKVIQCNIRDVTKRKQSEQDLKLLNTCISNLNDIVLITEAEPLDEPGPKIVFVNEAFERLSGYGTAEVLGRSPRFLQGEKTDRSVLAEMHTALVQQKPIRRQIINYGKNGNPYWLDVDIVPIFNDAGKITHFAAIERDITEQKRAEIVATRLASIVEFSDDAIIGKDLSSIITSWNNGAEKIFGYTATEMVGASIMRLIPADRQDEENHILGKIKCGESVQHFETLRQTKDGRLINVSVTASPIKDSTGKPIGVSKVARDITASKRAEGLMREREEQLRLYAEHSPVAVAMFDRDMKYLVASQSWIEDFRLGNQTIIGRSHYEVFPDIPQHWIEIHRRCLAGAVEKCEEDPFPRSDGQTDWIRWEIRPWRQADGAIGGIIIFSECITERKRTENALRESRATLDSALASMSDAVFITDGNGQFIDFNDAFVSLHRFRNRDECYKVFTEYADFLEVFMPNGELAPLDMWAVPRALRGETVANAEFTLRRKDSGETWVASYSFGPIRNKEGVIVGSVTVARDITERKRDAKQIAEQAALLDKTQDAILVRDLEGGILFWNKGAERMYGWTHQEVMGRNIGELLYTNPKKFGEFNGLAISQGEWSGELQHLTKDKGEITVEARWTLLRDSEGRPKSVLAINTDITERKKIETQFMRAQRMESIGTLAGGIAHDLNNILAPIMMSIDILKGTSDTPQTTKILETIEISAKRGADIVRQVLSFARGVEGQKIEVQPKHLLNDLESIIKDTFPKDIRLQFSIPNDTWTILGDPTQLYQILLNFCVNARDAMPNGGNLTVGIENCVLDEHYPTMNAMAKPGRYIRISVTDSGTGMPQEIIDKIFDPFFTTKELNKGTGLGLSTVMAIVKSHEGIINVYSEPGKGTTFKVCLPAMELFPDGRQKLPEETDSPRGNGETILVVDDEASILAITGQTLKAFGYRVLTATDGAEAVAIYAQNRNEIAVVLTDMNMPVMDGPAAIQALTRINPAVKIVAASGLNANGGLTNISDVRVKHFLTKPYTAATLLKTMRRILDEP